ncbi:DUF6124 family protein [Pseudomonas sp. 460]|uniref:DUF6124 family protein n=1 Tax=Pseudomonas sp. 460 TaxID=2485142 RepID=UPI003556D536
MNPEALMVHTYETFCSASILTMDLSGNLEGNPKQMTGQSECIWVGKSVQLPRRFSRNPRVASYLGIA